MSKKRHRTSRQEVLFFDLLTNSAICGQNFLSKLTLYDRDLFWSAYIHPSLYKSFFFTFADENTCPYVRTDDAYPRYLDAIVNNVKNEVACEVTCTFYQQFVCRSFAFYASASQCFISGDDKGLTTSTLYTGGFLFLLATPSSRSRTL